MINLSKEICFRFKEERKKLGLKQTELAAQVGCKQNALSMFEAGQPTKLSEETVKKLSERLGIPLEEEKIPQIGEPKVECVGVIHGFCPDCNCMSNLPYSIGGRVFFKPLLNLSSPTGGKYCACCGEVLEMRCPSCGAPINAGACCAWCGSQYVVNTLPSEIDATSWARIKADEISRLVAIR